MATGNHEQVTVTIHDGQTHETVTRQMTDDEKSQLGIDHPLVIVAPDPPDDA